MKKESYPGLLYIICALLIVGFGIRLWADYSKYLIYALSFYYYVILRGVEFLIPSAVLFIIARKLKRKSQ